ncbi:LPS export ABC transporter periplasmic protein LptC [Magnetospira sp. QH-2]|uniref:LPS export ABC transporter periplasmic protein LptC n=1 Tax=Magnetospira sp. (strain QH-2) TaxID=1288970 RepID=UPI0003E80BAF|nr:LPS export ABC transporter periplasmic protein LptC [Magnetospira sp. QH-2]CCQ75137.1 conserved protein of unknown function [Magnetospira sp. QH-2]
MTESVALSNNRRKAFTASPAPSLAELEAEAFRRQRKVAHYSRMVSVLKILFPIIAVVLMALIAVWPHIQPEDNRFRIGIASMEVGDVDQVGMVNARYLGADDEGRAFSVSADLARNLDGGTERVELEMPKADITLRDGTWLVLTANSGLYSQDAKSLDLKGAVNLFHDTGYEIRTSVARVDLNRNQASSDQPVVGQGPFGDLQAQGFEILDRGRTIQFTGKTKIVIRGDLLKGETP